jgi:hypothetical protein
MKPSAFKGFAILFRLTSMLLAAGCVSPQPVAAPSPRALAQTPSDATYMINGRPFALEGGQATIETVPGAASKTVIEISGEPVTGDLDQDGLPDVALLLVETTGGSGTFYHVAAAFNRDGHFVGTGVVLLGDRIVPQQLLIRHGILIVDYADRRPGEAMATPPSQNVSKYLVARAGQLEEIPLAEGEVIAAGKVVIGHEVRAFTPCGAGDAAWLIGSSPALPAMQVSYHQNMSDAPPYASLFMVLTGQPADRPAQGFGADYPAGFYATTLVHSLPGAFCSP